MHWCARRGRARLIGKRVLAPHGHVAGRLLQTPHAAQCQCEGAPLSREAVAQQDVRAGGPTPGTASQRARQEVPEVEAPVHPAPHQAQQGAQEDRVLPQVAAVQVCDGLEGVDAAHLQARAPGGEVVLQLSRTEEGRGKHGPAGGPCEELTTPYFQSTSAAYQPFGLSHGYLSAGPNEAQPRPHPHALRAVLCLATPILGRYRFVTPHVDDFQL